MTKKYTVIGSGVAGANAALTLLKKGYMVNMIDVGIIEHPALQSPLTFDSYDTVVCTHTLEHVQNISEAIIELRRVTKNRLIIVVPQQRPYKYTFDLHVHFFPYTHSLLSIIGNKSKEVICKEAQGDLFYYENKQEF
jgi:ubiquinone/menaquinone biosynthesis C-methylase UbiE